MAKNSVDVQVKVGVESKGFKQGMRELRKEEQEFKRQHREAMRQAKLDAQDGFGGIIAMAKKIAPAISAGAAALKVAQTAMQENQRFTDEWARVTESAKASYESFVDSLVNGDFTGFFTRINAVVDAAREAADALDALDTTKIFNDVRLSKISLDIERYKSIIRLGKDSPEEITRAKKGYEAALKEMQNVSLTSSSANLNAFAAKLAEYATTKGFSATSADFIEKNNQGYYQVKEGSLYEKYYKDLSTYLDWDARYKAERKAREDASYVDISTGKLITPRGAGNMSDKEWEEMRAFMELSDDKLRELFNLLKQAWSDEASVYRAMTQSARYMNAGGSASGGGGKPPAKVYAEGSIAEIEQRLATANEQVKLATDTAAREVARKLVMAVEEELAAAQSFRRDTGIESFESLPGLQGADYKPLSLDASVIKNQQGEIAANKDLSKTSEAAVDGLLLVSDTLQRLGITSQISNEGLSTTLSIISRFLGLVGSYIGGPWGKALSGVGLLVGSFSGGGIVGGTSYTGDRLTARVNSGEMILNSAQQGQLFKMLNGGGANGGASVVRGEDIYLSLRNYGRRSGKLILP